MSFVEVIVAEEQRHSIRVLCLAIKDPDDVELPGLASIGLSPERTENRDAISDLPMQLLGSEAADNRPGAGRQPFLLLVGRQDNLGNHSQEILRFNRILHEEILGLPHELAAKPGLMGDQGHAGNLLHARFIAVGQSLNDGYLVLHDQASGTR